MLKLGRRGKAGIYQIKGTVGGCRYRESTGTDQLPHAQTILAKRQAEIHERAVWGERHTCTFAEAVILYLQQGGEARFVGPLNDAFGSRRMSSITRSDVAAFAAATYPGRTAQTINRQVYSPLIAIWTAAHEAGMCARHEFKRPKLPPRDAVRFAREPDLIDLYPHCGPRLQAAVMCLSFTGGRAGEICRVVDADVDWDAQTILFRKTKGGKPHCVPLAPLAYEAMLPLRGTAGRLFGFSSRWALNRALKRACARAGIETLTSHKIGRHAFAARLLRHGKTLKDVQEAGGWSPQSLPMLAATYGHLEKKSVDASIRSADTDLAQLMPGREKHSRSQRLKR
jgi:integrase